MSDIINFDRIKDEIKNVVAEIAEIPADQIKDDAKFFEDLGIDSMMALEIVAALEKKYKVLIPEDQIPAIRSLQDIHNLLDKLLKK